MMTPVQLTFRDMDSSPALEGFVRRWMTKLERVYPRIERCDVTVERPHQSHKHGQLYRVLVRLAVPGPDIVVSHEHPLDGAHENAYVAVRDAFRAARRQLEDHARRLRGFVKPRVQPQAAPVPAPEPAPEPAPDEPDAEEPDAVA
ncbi:MAG: ribosome-associated translation inhibitor RaiA [Deltaproteobacteria bacterium]|nr:ribosome-associated translation inhibitor RaiA [Deltaproteobacteria bacterium]MCW5801641.1 ribosome-associated translation inhibitor RaiA [Deltaproteobacteria bacterium]